MPSLIGSFYAIQNQCCGPGFESGSGSISQRHGSADPDPHQNVMNPQHIFENRASADEPSPSKDTELVIEKENSWVNMLGKEKIKNLSAFCTAEAGVLVRKLSQLIHLS
jgi:hypothetical protein